MWKDTSGHFVTASPETRVLWTSAKMGVVRATAAHEVRAVDLHTPRHVGCLLAKATTAQFERLGAIVHIDTVNDISGDVNMFESVKHENVNGGTCTDMVYDVLMTDSNATVCTARVHMDDIMLGVCGGESSCPMVFHALKHLNSIRESMPDVTETLQRAFGGTMSTNDEMHCVASAESANRRMFPIGSNVDARSMLGTHIDKTVLFNQDREVTHHITTYTVRAIDPSLVMSSTSKRYLVSQHVKIVDAGGVYSADLTMSIAGIAIRGDSMCTDEAIHTTHPYTSLVEDRGVSTRTSTMHVFTNAKHYSMLFTHIHDAGYARSLQLPAYASMNALCMSGNSIRSDIDQIMKTASMETLMDCGDLPLTVARGSSSPFICLVVPGVELGVSGVELGEECEGTYVTEASFENEDSYLVDLQKIDVRQQVAEDPVDMPKIDACHQVPVNTMNIDALPAPVQNALRRQWGF
jgi:hypothetical protein